MYQQRAISPHTSLGILDLKAFSAQMHLQGKRLIEKAGSKYVLQELLKSEETLLDYTPFNKPVLRNNSGYISISHSHDMLVVILDTQQPTGVDIELIRDKVLNIRHKFLCTEELERAGENIDSLITLWAAKEALYKVYGEKELDFSRHLFIELTGTDEFYGLIKLPDFERKFLMKQETINNYRLVYTLYEL